MAMAQVLLGDDGLGYELARRLDGCGAWRAWLGDAAYSAFAPSLASPSTWESFISPSSSASVACNSNNPALSKAHVHLQLRARALLYDKASAALYLRQDCGGPSTLSGLNSTYLQLHGDDVYFSLEKDAQDGSAPPNPSQSKVQSRSVSSPSKVNGNYFSRSGGPRINDTENESVTRKDRHDDLPDLWYDQFIEKYRTTKQLKFPPGDQELWKRTPEGMASYLKLLGMHKRRRLVFKDDQNMGYSNSAFDIGSHKHQDMTEDEVFMIPEVMFPFNCVPDTAIIPLNEPENYRKVDVYGVLDSLPHLMNPSPALIERYGIMPEYLRVDFGRTKFRGKRASEGSTKALSHEQASQVSQKVVSRVLAGIGVDGGTDISMRVLSQFLGSHICKLGRVLKILSDSYRKQFTSTELIKMFLKTTGYGNLGQLSDYLKDSTRVLSHQSQQIRALQAQQQAHQLQVHQQQAQRPTLAQLNALRPQNINFQLQQMQLKMQMQQQQQQQQQQQPPQQQQMHQQQQQMHIHQQQLQLHQQHPQQQQQMQMNQQQTQQQQQQIQMQQQQLQIRQQQLLQQQLRQRQLSNPHSSGMIIDKDRPMVEIKTENMTESSSDGPFNPAANRQQLQFRHQQMANASHLTQPGKQFTQFNIQSPQLQQQGSFSVRTPPVKVEGFQELMGGGDSEERKLTSPSK